MAITNGYATLAQLKQSLRITDSIDDSILELAIESASRAIDGHTHRYFYSAGTASRYYAAESATLTQIDDLAGTAITLETSGSINGVYDVVWDAADYQLEPLNGLADGLQVPYTRIRAIRTLLFPERNEQALVKVTGVWGYSSVPIAITQACLIQAARLFKRADSPLGVAGWGDMGAIEVRSVDPDVASLLSPYVKDQSYV